MIKRTTDLAVSLSALLLFSPLFVMIAVAIRTDSKGPTFYRGSRVGRFNTDFRIFKFRTMVPDAEQLGGPSTAGHDPRQTRVGRLLRKYKLDELPQFMNVFMGEMSVVGPRPEVREYVDMFTDQERVILDLRPGITDWASLWNNDEGAILADAPDPEVAYVEIIRPKKLRLQLKYARERTFWIDLKIIWLTAVTAVTGNSWDIEAKSEKELGVKSVK